MWRLGHHAVAWSLSDSGLATVERCWLCSCVMDHQGMRLGKEIAELNGWYWWSCRLNATAETGNLQRSNQCPLWSQGVLRAVDLRQRQPKFLQCCSMVGRQRDGGICWAAITGGWFSNWLILATMNHPVLVVDGHAWIKEVWPCLIVSYDDPAHVESWEWNKASANRLISSRPEWSWPWFSVYFFFRNQDSILLTYMVALNSFDLCSVCLFFIVGFQVLLFWVMIGKYSVDSSWHLSVGSTMYCVAVGSWEVVR